jgi:hypothetical protein
LKNFNFYFKLEGYYVQFDEVEQEREKWKKKGACPYDDDWLFDSVLVIIVYKPPSSSFPSRSTTGCEYLFVVVEVYV